MSKKPDPLDQVLLHEKNKARLTPLRCVPIRAPQSAVQVALGSPLTQHFADHEDLLSNVLTKALGRLKAIMNGSKDETVIRDVKRLLQRVKIASDVFGFKAQKPSEGQPDHRTLPKAGRIRPTAVNRVGEDTKEVRTHE